MPAFLNPPCPFLPETDRIIPAAEIVALGKDRGPVFYEASLRYGQSRWRLGFPAQALLQCNRALSCCLPGTEPVLRQWPLPYGTISWLMVNPKEGQFLGNPRRHFQHLATRMVPPHQDLRTWRAWACWYLAKAVLPEAAFPGDPKQIRGEGITEPAFAQIKERLGALSPANDVEVWLKALEWSKPWHVRDHYHGGEAPAVRFESIGADRLPCIRELALAIWPCVYPGIISQEQITYMLDLRYSLEALRADHDKGVCFALVYVESQAVGFTAFEPRQENGEAFLHKLYLLPEFAGRGVGAQALQWVAEQARTLGLPSLRLFVNKHNTGAIRAYQRSGFTFDKDVVTDIGEGFVMDDYVMVKKLG
ncbi:MAG: Ribosomal protein acetylase RimI [Verrucomicrobiaceae bacterium]|nr:Ribosomal protein acetylase RimI [Verrucomicrobiaceae bacterium]